MTSLSTGWFVLTDSPVHACAETHRTLLETCLGHSVSRLRLLRLFFKKLMFSKDLCSESRSMGTCSGSFFAKRHR